MRNFHSVINAIFIGGLCFAFAACSPLETERGHVMDEMVMKQAVIGMSSQDDIRALLGSPSTMSDFGDPTWYYIRSKRQQTAFFRPEIIEREITKIVFDEAGTLQSVNSYTLEDGKVVASVKETTPTEGQGLGFIEQMLSNMGRFNAPSGGQQ